MENFAYICCSLFSSQVVSDSATPWTAAWQGSLSMGFSRQEYWSGLPFPSPGDLPNQRLNPHLLHWQVGSLLLSHQGSTSWHIELPRPGGPGIEPLPPALEAESTRKALCQVITAARRLAMKRVPIEKPFQFLSINFHIYFTKIKIY